MNKNKVLKYKEKCSWLDYEIMLGSIKSRIINNNRKIVLKNQTYIRLFVI